MPKIYADLKKLDPTIAEAYLAVTKDNPDFVIDKAGAKRIFDPVFDGDKITENQAKALVLVIDTHKNALAKDTRHYLLGRAMSPVFEAALFLGTMKILWDDSELAGFFKALDAATKSLEFKSMGTKGAGTKIFYRPSHYQAIGKLVRDREIQVYRQRDSGLQVKITGATAEYDSDQDNIVLGDGTPPAEEANTIVHEVTHAIQDWLDIATIDKYLEADAYIAGAVNDKVIGTARDKSGKHPLDVAWNVAAPLVLDGTARTEKDAWLKAYDAVVAAVESFPAYKEGANDKKDLKEDGRRPRRKPKSAPPALQGSEQKNMEIILKALEGKK